MVSTAANVSDISQTANLMHGKEQVVGADAGYVGAQKRDEVQQALRVAEISRATLDAPD
ncbi:MAG: hypothetical protein HY525_00340 [Betaproteobacteria bacterium]|nr:hypothetical protein [Betaproteobacteria bacterium]